MAQWLQTLAAPTEGGFGSQHPHNASQLPATSTPGHPISSSDLSWL